MRLLFTDLKGLGVDDPSSALRSVTGYDLAAWNRRWQKQPARIVDGQAPPRRRPHRLAASTRVTSPGARGSATC